MEGDVQSARKRRKRGGKKHKKNKEEVEANSMSAEQLKADAIEQMDDAKSSVKRKRNDLNEESIASKMLKLASGTLKARNDFVNQEDADEVEKILERKKSRDIIPPMRNKKKKEKVSAKKSKGKGDDGDTRPQKRKTSLKNDKPDKGASKGAKSCKTDADSKPKEEKKVFDFDSPEKLLASLIAPITVERFFAEYWEKKPLLIRRKDKVYAEMYKTLFSRKILEDILQKRNVQFEKDINVCRFDGEKRESLNQDGRATKKKIKNLMDNDKATVQFHQPQCYQDELWHINECLESYFHSLVGANIYMTPKDSQGLAPHYDDVDVFILQLEGHKKWQLHKPPMQLPRDYSKDLDQSTIGKPTHDITLKAGDLLYFPRGTIHYAMTPADSPSHSTHVTISTYQRSSWGDLLSLAMPSILQAAVGSSVQFRRGLPVSYLGANEEQITQQRTHLKQLIQSLANHVESHDHGAANEMMCDFVANRLPPYMKGGKADEPKGSMPSDSSKVRLAFPHHTYVTTKEKKSLEEMDDEEDEEDDEEEEDGSDEGEDEEEESDDEEEDDSKLEIQDGSYLEHVDTDQDEEEDDEEEEEDDDEPSEFFVYHSLKNTRDDHMMGSEPKQCSGLKSPIEYLSAMKQLQEAEGKWISVSDLDGDDNAQLLVSLWSEGLLEVK